jgi:hypothetical protein
MATVIYLACALLAVVRMRRFIAELSRHDPAVLDLRAASDAILDLPARVFVTSMSIAATYARALFRRQDDDRLEDLRQTALLWWAVTLAMFGWVVVS